MAGSEDELDDPCSGGPYLQEMGETFKHQRQAIALSGDVPAPMSDPGIPAGPGVTDAQTAD